MPERPPLQVPDYNAGKSAQMIADEKNEEVQRLARQKAWLKEFLSELKYDESVVAPDDLPASQLRR